MCIKVQRPIGSKVTHVDILSSPSKILSASLAKPLMDLTSKAMRVTTTPTLTLEALHQLAKKRAKEKKRKPVDSSSEKKNDPSEVEIQSLRKGKRKRRDNSNEDVSCDGHVTTAQEGIRHIRLKNDEIDEEISKKTHRNNKQSKKNDDYQNGLDVSETSTPKTHTSKPKKKRRSPSPTRSPTPLCEDSDSDSISEAADSKEEDINTVMDDTQESTLTPKEVDKDSHLGLESLTHKRTSTQTPSGKTAVQRRLPSWIVHSEIIEEDIKKCSKSLSEFTIPSVLVKNLSKMGVDSLFPVQAHVIPELMSSIHGPLLTGLGGVTPRDISVCAPTGCGKTLCYVLPIVTALLKRVVCQVRAIVVVPSQELAIQVHQVFKSVVEGTGLKTGIICGGLKTGTPSGQASLESESEMLCDKFSYPTASCVDVVVATPGRLVEHISRSSFATLSSLRYLVVDEADKLLDQTFSRWLPKLLAAIATDKNAAVARLGYTNGGQRSLEETLLGLCSEVDRIRLLQMIDSCNPDLSDTDHFTVSTSQNSPSLQKLLFSATMSYNPEHLASLRLHQPKLFSIESALLSKDADTTYTLPQQLDEVVLSCSLEEKPLVLLHLLTQKPEEGQIHVLCFTNSRESTHRLFLLLQAFGVVSVAEMSGSVSTGKRTEVLNSFRKGKTKVLICSDQMARGMDVEGVSCVVNYEPPRKFQTYLHRAGRTARAGQRGVVYTLLARDEVHPFRTMIRQVSGKRKLQETTIGADDLRPFKEQYPEALAKLKSKLP